MTADVPGMGAHPVGDRIARQRFIGRSIGWSVPGMLVLLGGAYALLPPLPALDDAGARLALALRWLR